MLELLKPVTWFPPMWAFLCGIVASGVSAEGRWGLIAALSLATGTAVAQMGLVAFIGLAAPHAVRSTVRTSHAGLLGLSALMGGVLLLASDILARWVWAPEELPVGVLTSVLGGGYLLWRMQRSHGGMP